MPSVALPGSSNNVSPIWLCIAPYKAKTENIGGGQPKVIFVKFNDGRVVGYESIKGCARSLSISPDIVYGHMNKRWIKNNTMGIQFADNIEAFSSDTFAISIIVGIGKSNKTARKRRPCKSPQRKYKLLAKYSDGRTVYCYSVADASAKTGVDRKTITKYTNKQWIDNKHGLQFQTIKEEY